MSQGPLGGPRPLVTTNLKYDIVVTMSQVDFVDDELLAKDVVDVRVNAPRRAFTPWLRDRIGKVILASNKLAHPSRIRMVDEDSEVNPPGPVQGPPFADEGEVQVTWTYIIQGSGAGAFANTSTTSDRVISLHEVLINGNDEPISTSTVVREFDSGPATVENIRLTTE